MIPALIAGGSSLLGGLLGNSSAKKQARRQAKYDRQAMAQQFAYDIEREKRQMANIQNTEENRFKWLVKGAQDAGFNPLTVLGATGGQMGNTAAAAGQQAVARNAPLSQIGNAISNAGNNFAALMPDPIQQETGRLQNKLLAKQIAQIDRENLRYGQTGIRQTAGPAKIRNQYPIKTGFGEYVLGQDVKDEAYDIRTKDAATQTAFGGWQGNARLPAQEWVEGMYGDGVGLVYGGAKMAFDLMHNIRGWAYNNFGEPTPWEFSKKSYGGGSSGSAARKRNR